MRCIVQYHRTRNAILSLTCILISYAEYAIQEELALL